MGVSQSGVTRQVIPPVTPQLEAISPGGHGQMPAVVPPQDPPNVVLLQNVANTCYAISSCYVLSFIGLDGHLLPGNDPLQVNLTITLQQYLSGHPPQPNVIPLVNALNLTLPPANMMTIGTEQCAGEFLTALFSSINFQPFFSSFHISAYCPV